MEKEKNIDDLLLEACVAARAICTLLFCVGQTNLEMCDYKSESLCGIRLLGELLDDKLTAITFVLDENSEEATA